MLQALWYSVHSSVSKYVVHCTVHKAIRKRLFNNVSDIPGDIWTWQIALAASELLAYACMQLGTVIEANV